MLPRLQRLHTPSGQPSSIKGTPATKSSEEADLVSVEATWDTSGSYARLPNTYEAGVSCVKGINKFPYRKSKQSEAQA